MYLNGCLKMTSYKKDKYGNLKHQSLHSWFSIAICNFLLAAIYGAILRLAFVIEIEWIDFRNVLHGHSHVAMLGWLYLGIFIIFLKFFIPNFHDKKIYYFLFWITQFSVLGMAISFPIQGYGPFSIFFSTLHVLISYVFVINFFKHVNMDPKIRISRLFAKSSLVLMIISTLALFAMGPIMILELNSSTWYYMIIQFFLHFQFNGWFIFAVLAIVFYIFEKNQIQFKKNWTKSFFVLLLFSCFLTYALAITWAQPEPWLFMINSIGVLIQLGALFYFLLIINSLLIQIRQHLSSWEFSLLGISIISFGLKVFIQTAVVIPYIAEIAYTIRNYVIGFIHLILLGIITFAVFVAAKQIGIFQIQTKMVRSGLNLLISGIILSELLLVFQGTMLWAGFGFIPYYYSLLFIVSALMPIGIALILWNRFLEKSLIAD